MVFFSEDSEEDDYTEQFPLHSPKSLSPDVVLSPTLLTLSLSVEKGAISMILPVKVKKRFKIIQKCLKSVNIHDDIKIRM